MHANLKQKTSRYNGTHSVFFFNSLASDNFTRKAYIVPINMQLPLSVLSFKFIKSCLLLRRLWQYMRYVFVYIILDSLRLWCALNACLYHKHIKLKRLCVLTAVVTSCGQCNKYLFNLSITDSPICSVNRGGGIGRTYSNGVASNRAKFTRKTLSAEVAPQKLQQNQEDAEIHGGTQVALVGPCIHLDIELQNASSSHQ